MSADTAINEPKSLSTITACCITWLYSLPYLANQFQLDFMTGDQQPSAITNQLIERLDIDLALQAAGLGLWEVNLLTNHVIWDQRCSQLFGLDSPPTSYLDTLPHIHPEDAERVNQAVQWALNPQSDGSYQVTYRTLGEDGRTRWIQSTGRRYVDQQGRSVRFAGVAQDVTPQVADKKQAQQSEARFRTLIEEAPVATCLFVGPDMRIEIANQAMIQVWGKGPHVIGLPLAEALPELKDQHFLNTLAELYATGNAYQARGGRGDLVIEGQLRTFYFDYDFKPLRNPQGEVYAILETATDVTQQVLAQQRVEQSQRELLDLFEQSPVGLAILSADDELVFEWANSFYGQLVARKPEEITGKPLLEALPEIKGQGFDEILKKLVATGIPFTAPEVAADIMRAGQLTTIYVNLTYQPQKGLQGQVEGILVVATDVTQQVLARRKVEESESRLRAILATAPAGIGLFVGRNLVIENPNQTFIDIVGKGPDIAGLPLREAMPELITEGQPFLYILDQVFTTGEPFISPGSLVKIVKDGVLRDNYYNISYSPVRNAQGEIYAILDIAIDVTQEVQARQQLQETEATLRGAIALADMGTWTLDMTTGRTTYTERLQELFEFTQEYIDRDQLYNPIAEADRGRLEAAVRQAADPASGGLLDEEYTIITQRTGRHRIVRAQAQMYFDAQGQAYKMVGTMRDVTQERQTQLALEQQVQYRTEELAATNEELTATNEELAANNEELSSINEELTEATELLTRSNENLQQFAYVASHDLQEPLRKIQQFGDLLESRYGDQLGDGVGYIDRMRVAANRMSTLIRDLLTFSRISTQREMEIEMSLNNTVESVLADLELVIEETGAKVHVEPLPTVAGDPMQLGQLFQNLLSNALKFRQVDEAGVLLPPEIWVRAGWLAADHLPEGVKPVRRSAAYHRIEVVDNGIGFDDKYADRIFQVFQRLHSKADYAGTGIGLAICEKVVANHGGAITASSQVGQGATFSVYLPM